MEKLPHRSDTERRKQGEGPSEEPSLFPELDAYVSEQDSDETPEEKTRFEALAEKSRRAGLRIAQAAALLSIAGTLDYARTRYNIRESVPPGSERLYVHEDKETTDILNYLTGKVHMPESEKVFFYRQRVRKSMESLLYPVPGNIDEMSLDELVQIYVPAFAIIGGVTDKKFNELSPIQRKRLQKKAHEFITDAVPDYTYEPKLYTEIWELQKEVGKPRIRWAARGVAITAKMMASTTEDGRSFYDPINNTVYVSPNYVAGANLLAEEAHSKQFNDKPIVSSARLVQSWVRVVSRSVIHFENLKHSYEFEYDKPDSLEHEAHSVIEPAMETELYKRLGIEKKTEKDK
ncbi:MAG: hypothetical protein AAB472_02285 [Patescibacteria group bacterium]